jgi:hypothetical protein
VVGLVVKGLLNKQVAAVEAKKARERSRRTGIFQTKLQAATKPKS